MSYPLPPKKEEEFKSRQKGGKSEWIGKRQVETREIQGRRREGIGQGRGRKRSKV